jgi:hypothetical protein
MMQYVRDEQQRQILYNEAKAKLFEDDAPHPDIQAQ